MVMQKENMEVEKEFVLIHRMVIQNVVLILKLTTRK